MRRTCFSSRGEVMTPRTVACPEGITRSTVLELCRKHAIAVAETDLSLVDFYRADEMFCTGTMGEIAPVVEVDGRRIGDGRCGPVTLRLRNSSRNSRTAKGRSSWKPKTTLYRRKLGDSASRPYDESHRFRSLLMSDAPSGPIAPIQFVSDEHGQTVSVIVPIELWREIEAEQKPPTCSSRTRCGDDYSKRSNGATA